MVIINNNHIKKLIDDSLNSKSKRSHFLLHHTHEDKIQSILFCIQPDTYIAAHKHYNDTETICCLKGRMAVIFYYDNGDIEDVIELNSNDLNKIIKFNPSRWHSYICLEKDTVGLEIKEGPYLEKNIIKARWFSDMESKCPENYLNKLKLHVGEIISKKEGVT
ncbi:WbuC family cupin fold metalloprotein [Alkalihalobacterium alkalinitrilicum]|uniref:WbuC family cupin fold metalloprotein n=1 Tax=Alkalihalobacterium alkalinitrilicum TaxID=427920 RepID=UPI00130352F3|nr:WbuC family cupin fold metalloprotein [Alkalihalobacterium alkalinitrilicum]